MSKSEYKGYSVRYEVDSEAGLIVGTVVGLRDAIVFEVKSMEEAEPALKEAVDAYLEMCAEDGVDPERPYSGKTMLRIPPQIHRRFDRLAQDKGQSLNTVLNAALESYLLAVDASEEATEGERDTRYCESQVAVGSEAIYEGLNEEEVPTFSLV